MAISTNLGDLIKYIPSGDSKDDECTVATVQGVDKDGNIIICLPGGEVKVIEDDKYLSTTLTVTM